MSKKRFSFEDDPAFSDFTAEDWAEWRKNHQGEGVQSSICAGCLNQLEDGGCDIYDAFVQRDIILKGECDEHIT